MRADIQIEAYKLRQTLNRADLRHFVCLPVDVVEEILGRAALLERNLYLTCDADSDQVTCGLKTVWTTGGRAACAYCLAVTAFPTERTQATLEYAYGPLAPARVGE